MPKNKNNSEFPTKHAEIRLPYFKQGDDLHGCIIKDANGKVDVRATLLNHAELLEGTASILREIRDKIPEINDMKINGDTHWIGIEGDERVIQSLVDAELAYYNEFDDEFDESDDSESSSEDQDDEDNDDSDDEDDDEDDDSESSSSSDSTDTEGEGEEVVA